MPRPKSTKPWDMRVLSSIWRDDDFCSLSAMAQWLAFRSIGQLGRDCSEGGLQYTAADFELDPLMFELLASELVRVGIFTWVDEGRVEVHRYKNLIFPMRSARSIIPAWVRAKVMERDGWKCKRCDATDRLELDHIYPWSLGGSDDEENLQVLCRTCNWRKGVTV